MYGDFTALRAKISCSRNKTPSLITVSLNCSADLRSAGSGTSRLRLGNLPDNIGLTIVSVQADRDVSATADREVSATADEDVSVTADPPRRVGAQLVIDYNFYRRKVPNFTQKLDVESTII